MSGILLASASQGYWLPDDLVSTTDFQISPSPAAAILKFTSNGEILDEDNLNVGYWLLPIDGVAPGDFEIKANSASPDTPSSGLMDSWTPLTSTRQWQQSQIGTGSTQTDFTIEIRKSSGPTLVTKPCRLIATVDL